MRTPLFPVEFLKPLTSESVTTEEKLMEICRKPVVQEALFLASPDLFSQMQQWLDGKLTDKKKRERLHYSLMRYLLRMSTRPTPFGLFAGFSLGKWDLEGGVELPEQSQYKRSTRLDMNYLCALAQDLAKHPVIKENILHYPNSSIYRVGDQLRYVEYRYRNTRRTHHIVAVDHSDYLQTILDRAASGAYLKELAELLVDDEITFEEAHEFIDELVDSQVLVNQLEPAITGPAFIDQILTVLEPIQGIDEVKKLILRAKDSLEDIDNSEIGSTVSNYHKIAEELGPLGTSFELKFLFQTDMAKPTIQCKLDREIVGDVLKAFEVMNKFSPQRSGNNLSQFQDAFYERYETREVPLLKALDTECGVGYRQTGAGAGDVAPLVDDLALPGTASTSSDLAWNRLQRFLFSKYKDAMKNDSYEVELTDKELEPFESDWSNLPDTFSSMVHIIEEKSEKFPRMRLVVSGMGGSSAGNLLGRFCHADPDTDTFVKEITEKEKELHPDTLLAETIHLPESRVGNVLIRPVLRQYEIPYLAKSAVPTEDQIKVQDLMVSVQRNRIVLRSKRLNKEILPHLTNAHNFSYNSLPVYHFLCDLQTQGLRGGMGFSWGALAGEYEFQPRVVYRNVILSTASWNIKLEDIKKFLEMEDDLQLVEAVKKWRQERNMPPEVLLVDNDNKLYINLDNALCIRTLFSVTKKRPGFEVEEFLHNSDNPVVKSKEGTFTNEFAMSFHKIKEDNTSETSTGKV